MDAFSEVLSGVKLKGALFFSADSRHRGRSRRRVEGAGISAGAGAPHLVVYHLVVDGVARATLPDGRTLTLEPGESSCFPRMIPMS